MAGRYMIRGTSSRTGAVMWVRQDGTPSAHKSEGGRWGLAEALLEVDRYTASLVRVVGRCAWALDVLEVCASCSSELRTPGGERCPPCAWRFSAGFRPVTK